MKRTDQPVILEPQIMDYAWGSKTAIQSLLGKPPGPDPWAELWMGAHPKAPGKIHCDGQTVALDRLIEQAPEAIVGPAIAEKFERTLPYLFKVLAAEQPLSIQAHPDRAMAAEGFERENAEGIPIAAAHRNYRDPWPKPEIICALEPFDALYGFRPPAAMTELLQRFCPASLAAAGKALQRSPDGAGIKTLFETLLTLAQDRKTEVIEEARRNAADIQSEESRWIVRLHDAYPEDIGVLSPLILNLVRLEPGQAMFLPAGCLHAYLSGVGIELMANSDNVLRGGLTRKHIDVGELLRVLQFAPSTPEILEPEPAGPGQWRYRLTVDEFALSVICLAGAKPYAGPAQHSAEILLCVNGTARIFGPETTPPVEMEKGTAALIPAAAGKYRIEGIARLYKASVPLENQPISGSNDR
ncbi:MAG: mannose-6-phosphate isomerase, class I [Thermodesulfobacteriota bacterium]